jgi:hypothetical protein
MKRIVVRLVSENRAPLTNRAQCMFPAQLFAQNIQCPTITALKERAYTGQNLFSELRRKNTSTTQEMGVVTKLTLLFSTTMKGINFGISHTVNRGIDWYYNRWNSLTAVGAI